MRGFRDRLVYDAARGEYRDGAIRYLMIRPDSLMGLLHELPAELHPDVLTAFARSVARHGGKSASSYRAAGADVLASIVSTAPALGWGVWSLTQADEGLRLSVENSPFAAGFGRADAPVCYPIMGMLRAVAGMLYACDADVSETTCAAVEGGTVCRFTVVPAWHTESEPSTHSAP